MNPASIAYSLTAARENARRAREIVSTELWECLNTTNARMPRRLQTEKVHEFFQWVRERAALAVGIVDSSTSRDEAWQFFTLGRSIERADMTARLLATRSLTEASGPSWTTILRSCGAYEAYLRTYRGMPSARNAAEFLLLDRLFPRSIIFSIQRAEDCMRAIDPRADRVGHSNTGAARARADPQRPRVPPDRRDPRRAAAAHGSRAEGHARGIRGDPRSGSSRRRPSRAGSERSHEATAHRAPDRLQLPGRRLGVVQRGADAARARPTASSC